MSSETEIGVVGKKHLCCACKCLADIGTFVYHPRTNKWALKCIECFENDASVCDKFVCAVPIAHQEVVVPSNESETSKELPGWFSWWNIKEKVYSVWKPKTV